MEDWISIIFDEGARFLTGGFFARDGVKQYHNKSNFKALNYGSTSQTFIVTSSIQGLKIVKKVYNDKFRFNIIGHENTREVYEKEKQILFANRDIPIL